MAKRHITPMGKHKPLGSSWSKMDTGAFSRSYMPDQPSHAFRCFTTGQYDNMAETYAKHKQMLDKQEALGLLDDMLSNY